MQQMPAQNCAQPLPPAQWEEEKRAAMGEP
jgi:hypothetical protein